MLFASLLVHVHVSGDVQSWAGVMCDNCGACRPIEFGLGAVGKCIDLAWPVLDARTASHVDRFPTLLVEVRALGGG